MGNVISIKNLNYKDIIKDITLDLEKNTTYAIIGKSGSGKTIFLKCLAGLLEYNGIISNIRKNDVSIYLNTTKFMQDTVYLNLEMPLINSGINSSEAKKKIYDMCDSLNISSILYKKIDELSYSESKLVKFAQSIILEPKILLIDNLFDSLDKKSRNMVWSVIKKMKKSTIIIVTNNSEDILQCKNTIIMNEGKIINSDKTLKIISQESFFNKNKLSMPFMADLSHKLMLYGMIDRIIIDKHEMVNEIWK